MKPTDKRSEANGKRVRKRPSAMQSPFTHRSNRPVQGWFTCHLEVHLSTMAGDTNLITFIDLSERKAAEEAMQQREMELIEAQRLAGVGSWQWEPRTDTVIWSKELYHLMGIDPTLPAPSYKEQAHLFAAESWERLQRAVQGAFQTGTSYELDLEVVRPESIAKWEVARGEPVRDKGGQIIGLRGTVQDITERKRAEAALSSVSRKLIEAQEQERTRIGRELHDDIGQRLALLAIELQRLHEDPLVLPEVRSRMGELQKQISEIATDIQSLSHELHSAKLQYLGIAAALRGFCREFGEQQKVEVDFQAHDLPSPLSPDISLCLFRVLQEALHNSAKHSGVRRFEVRLWGTSDEIHLTVKDSGAGFDREQQRRAEGLGLISMEERLKLVNGTLYNRIATEAWYHDPRSRASQSRMRLNAGGWVRTRLERDLVNPAQLALREPHRGGIAWELACRQTGRVRDGYVAGLRHSLPLG